MWLALQVRPRSRSLDRDRAMPRPFGHWRTSAANLCISLSENDVADQERGALQSMRGLQERGALVLKAFPGFVLSKSVWSLVLWSSVSPFVVCGALARSS